MDGPAYAAAPIISAKVAAYLARHRAAAVTSLPDAATIEAVINAAFWASLRREEGYIPRISLALLSCDEAIQPLVLERPLSLVPDVLTRVAPIVEHAGIHLGVWAEGGELFVWGTIRTIPPFCIVVEAPAPGLLVVKHPTVEETLKFVNVAVIEGDKIKVVDQHASSLPDCPELVTSLLGFDSPSRWGGSLNVLVQLAVSMRAHGRGGSLLVVPAGSESWRESILMPMPYAVTPPFAELAELSRENPSGESDRLLWKEKLADAVDAIAGLTAVDGAAVMNSNYEVLGFGAKIARGMGRPHVEQVTLTEPIERNVAVLMHPEQLGGTRHLSAAQFVQDQQDAIALVASQDGRFTVFAWSPCETMVHAHRVDALLL
jgi:hypothetical protein